MHPTHLCTHTFFKKILIKAGLHDPDYKDKEDAKSNQGLKPGLSIKYPSC